MRIAIVCSYYPWPPSVGGVETIVRNVSTELAKRGHEVHVITAPFDVTTGKQVSDYGVEERDGVIVHKLKPGKVKIGYARLLKGLKETIEKIKPEIVHEHNLHPHLFQLAGWRSELRYKLVAELHHPAVNLDFFVQKILLPFTAYLMKRISSNIDVFLAHTNLEKSWLISKDVREDAIEVIRPPLIPSRLFLYGVKAASDSPSRLLYVGRIVPKKGLHVLIKALSLVNNVGNIELAIAGPVEEKYLRKLQNLVAELKLEIHVEFKGRITEKEKVGLMSACSVFVCPTLADYHPIVLVEAQALGAPVISTKVGAIPEIVLHGKTGLLIEPNNERELAKAIDALLEDESLRRRFSLNARKFAENFVLERHVDKLEALYHEVLNHK